jgi:peptidoglycan hydrolase-like protein with peptidoglycan-binding domain
VQFVQRDLACNDLWAESLERSRARRADAARGGRRRAGAAARGRRAGGQSPRPAIELAVADPGRRDLTDAELWEWSQRRSRERRELAAAEGFQLPARSASVAALVALTGGPVAGIAVAKAITSGGGGERQALVLPASAAASHEPERASAGAAPSPASAGAAPSPATPSRAAPAPVESRVAPAERGGERREPPRPAAVARVGSSTATAVPADSVRATTTSTAAKQATPAPKGGGVRALQRALEVPVDGDFGAQTEKALKRWQRGHGLEADGVAGPQTRAALGLGQGGVLERKRSEPPRKGRGEGRKKEHARSSRPRRGGGVADLQRAIGVAPDGVFGPATERALKRWQRRHGLEADGVAGPQTRRALGLGQGRVLKRKRSRAGRAGGGHQRAKHHQRRGGGVADLQRAIGVTPDGVFGPATERALKRWQRRHGLAADGVAGPQTRRALGLGPGPILKRRHPAGHRRHSSGGGSSVVQRVIAAANAIATKPYRYGGGHGSWSDSGYDCSGSVSYALHGGGLLSSPLDSSGFMSYGAPGPGRHITIYANSGHVYMTIDGRRFDTSARSETGSRWTSTQRSSAGYVVRHPRGL